MKNKKVLFACIAVGILLIAGGIFGWKYYQDYNNVVTVIPVEYLNSDWAVDQEGSSGTVTSSLTQSIVPDSDEEVDKIYVEVGQQVKIGDKILTYSMAVERLDLELKGYDVQELEYSIKRAEKELANLRKEIVTDSSDSYGSSNSNKALLASADSQDSTKQADSSITTLGASSGVKARLLTAGTSDQENSSENTTASDSEESTTTATEDTTTATGDDTKTEVDVKDQTTSTDETTSTQKTTSTEKTTSTQKSTSSTKKNTSSTKKSTSTKTSSTKKTTTTTTATTSATTQEETVTYTAAEIKEMITAKENEIADLKLQLKEEQLEYDTLKKEVEDGTITAAVAGVVKEVNDPTEAAANGSPVVVIVSADELYVQGVIDEYSYSTLQVGTMITATSWDTGNVFQARITEISPYPVDNANYYGAYSSNPNLSYYPYTAVIEGGTDGIESGESVSISFEQSETIGEGDSIYLPLAYVRTESNYSYVYISDAEGRLKKQVVTTGQTLYNSVIEVKSGLSYEDCVAFPYGNTVKEGARTEVSEDGMDIVY